MCRRNPVDGRAIEWPSTVRSLWMRLASQFEKLGFGQRSMARPIKAMTAAAPAPSKAHSQRANCGRAIGGGQGGLGIPATGNALQPPPSTQKCASQRPTLMPTAMATAIRTIATARLTRQG